MLGHANNDAYRYETRYTRIMYLTDDTLSDLDATCSFIDELLELNSRSNKLPIIISISSGGGSLSCMSSIIDTMSAIGAPVYTQAVGIVASAATTILSAGARGHRYALPTAKIMIHEPTLTGNLSVTAKQLDIERRVLEMERDDLLNFLINNTGKTRKQILADIKHDRWFSAQQAQEYGLIDAIGMLPEMAQLQRPTIPGDEV